MPQDVEEAEARAAFIWVLGEHGSHIQVCGSTSHFLHLCRGGCYGVPQEINSPPAAATKRASPHGLLAGTLTGFGMSCWCRKTLCTFC